MAQDGHVVAELADLRRRFVHEGQATVRCPYGERSEKRVVRPGPDQGPYFRGGQVEAVTAQHEVQAGRVATPYLEAVERAEGDVDGPQRAKSSGAGPGALVEQAERGRQ